MKTKIITAICIATIAGSISFLVGCGASKEQNETTETTQTAATVSTIESTSVSETTEASTYQTEISTSPTEEVTYYVPPSTDEDGNPIAISPEEYAVAHN